MNRSQKMLIVLFSLLVVQPVVASQNKTEFHKVHYEVMHGKKLYANPKLAAYVQRIGKKLAANSDKPDVDYNFFVLDDESVNAFTPGHGLVYINRGLISLMISEGQLASVLANEIGHNTGRHIQRGKTKRVLGNIGAITAGILVGNSGVRNAISMANNEKYYAFRRELELEADEYGAEYLYRTGYDPEEMLEMLGLLKDHSTFISKVSSGGKGSYHGVLADHPRTDKRLQEVVLKAGTLPPGENFIGRLEFRNIMGGVTYGYNYDGNKRLDQERFTQKSLGITFVYPKYWSQTTKGKNIILKNESKTIQLKIIVEKTVDKSLSSQKALKVKFPNDLTDITTIREKSTKDLGTHARRPQQRVAIIQIGRNSYHFQGIAKNNQLSDAQDKDFIEIIESFRRATRRDLSPEERKEIYFKRLEPGETFSSLAIQEQTLGVHTEAHLRLMNGYYPRGEPEPGTYIKMVK